MCRSIIKTTHKKDFSGGTRFSRSVYRVVNLLCALALGIAMFHPAAARAAAVDWEGWSFDFSTNNNSSGLVLSNVKYGDKEILAKASMPVMRVEYDNDVCGPYADILSRFALRAALSGAPDSACDGESVCQRTFDRNGEKMLEVGSNWQIGEYQIYQTWYFSENGYIDARVYSRGLQCTVNHSHHAHWLFDFDIEGPENDQIRRETGVVESTEFNDMRTTSAFWTIQDSVTGQQVQVIPSSDDGQADDFSDTDVAVRAYKSSEVGRWQLGARGEIGDNYINNESINNNDLVFWYVSHLPHSASEGSSVWHASGPRIQIITDEPLPEPPAPEPEPVAEPTGDNLLANGDFESDDAGWFDCASNQNTTITASSVAGSTSGIRIENGGCLYQEVDAAAGDNYTLSCLAERSGNNWTIMELSYLDAEFNALTTEIQQINADGGFSAYQLNGTAPEGTVYALTLLYSEDNTVFDNCILVAGLSPEPEPEPDPADPLESSNLISNAGFEADLTNWNSCASADAVSQSTDAHSGESALNITAGGCLYQEFPIVPGSTYTMSCQAKFSGSLYTSITLSLMDENYTSLQTTEIPVISAEYDSYAATLTAPASSSIGTVVMYSEEPGQFDSCEVILEPGST